MTESDQGLEEAQTERREPVFNIATVVVVMIGICVLVHLVRVYLLTPDQDFALILRAAFIPARYSGDYLIDIYAITSPITYSFVHGSFLHLAINMIWLAAFGSPLANRIGPVRFVAFWVFTAVAAAALHYVLHANEAVPVIGASGAISGMMAAAARFGFAVDRSLRRPAFVGPRLRAREVVRRRAVVVFLTVWFVVNLVTGLGVLASNGGPIIAWEAHIGGFVAGLFGLVLFDRPGTSRNKSP